MAGATDDLLDRHMVSGKGEHSGVGVLAAQVALVLDTLGGRQEVRVDRHGPDGGSDLAHGLADRVEKGAAGVLHQMPAISDLDGVWQRLGCGQGISAAPVAGDGGDLGLSAQPSLGCVGFTVRQQADRAPSLKVTDDRPIAMIASPRPVVDANHVGGWSRRAAAPSNYPQQGVVADGKHQALGQAGSGSTAQRQAQVMDKAIKPRRPSRPRLQDAVVEPLRKNASAADDGFTPEAAHRRHQLDGPTGHRQINDVPAVTAMDATARDAAPRTSTGRAGAANLHGCYRANGCSADHREA